MVGGQFSVGALHRSLAGCVLLGLAGSVVFMISGRQDLGHRFKLGSVFWFFLALLFTGGVIRLGVGAKIWGGAVLGVILLCLEIWFIQRWWRQGHSA
jgi:hypothetical protein